MLNSRDKLYQALSDKYDLGTKEEFNSKMDNPESRKRLYSAVSSDFDLGSYEEFEGKVSPVKKKDGTKALSPSTTQPVSTESEQTSGSLGIFPKPQSPTQIVLEGNNQIAQKQQTKTPIVQKDLTASEKEMGTMAWNLEKLKKVNPEIEKTGKEYLAVQKVNDDKVAQIKQEVDDEFNKSGFFNGLQEGAKKGWNAFVDVIGAGGSEETKNTWKADTDLFKKEAEEVKKKILIEASEAKSNNKPAPVYSQEQINEMIKARKVKKLVDSEKQSQVRSYLEDQESQKDQFGKTKRERMEIYKVQELSSLSEKDAENLKKQNIVLPALSNVMTKLKDVKDKTSLTQEEVEQAKLDYDDYVKLSEQAIELKEEFSNNKEKIKDGQQALDLFKRDYSFARHFKNLYASVEEIAGGIGGAIDYGYEVNDYLKKTLGVPTLPSAEDDEARMLISGATEDVFKEAKQLKSETAKPITVEDINGFDDMGSWFADMITSQAPIFATIATGAPGIATLGVSSTGQKYENMLEEMIPEPGKMVKNYSQKQLVGIPAVYGLSETASAMVDRYLMKTAQRTYNSMTSGERKLFADGIAKRLFEGVKEAGKGTVIEGIDEATTQFAQNLADKTLGEDPNKSLLDGVKDSFVAGAVMGGMIKTVPMVVAQATKLYTNKTDKGIQEQAKQIMEFQAQLDAGNISEASRKTIEEQLAKAKEKFNTLLEERVVDVSTLSNAQFNEIGRLEKAQANIKSKAEEIKNDTSLNVEIKKQILGNLKEEFKSNEQRRVDLLERGASVQLEKLDESEAIRLKDKAQRQLMKELNPDGTKNITLNDEQISKRAIEIYKQEQLKVKQKDAETQVPATEAEVESKTEIQEQPEEKKGIAKKGRYEYEGEVYVYDGTSLIKEGTNEMMPIGFEEDSVFSKIINQGKFISDAQESKLSAQDKEVEVAQEPIAPKENDEVELEPRIKGGLPRTMIFKDGEWQQKVGGQISPISESVKQEAQTKFDEKQAQGNTPVDGNIRPATEQVGEMATEQSPKTEVAETEVVESAVEPKPSEGVAEVTDLEYSEFVDNGIVSKERLNSIAEKVKNNSELTERETAIFTDKTSEINRILKEQQPTRKETRKKAVEVKIDEIANSVKNLESVFGIKIKAQGDDINIQGTSREQLIDFIAKTAKEIAKTGIEIDEAIRTVIDEIKKSFDTDVEVDEVRGLVEEKPEPKKEKDFKGKETSFEYSASFIPNSGEVSEYLSGQTIEKYTGEKPSNDQAIKTVKLVDALKHGINTIELAKEQFGDEYVSKILEFAENSNIPVEARALLYVSLENDLNKQIKENPENKADLKKKLNLVYQKSQAFARSTSLAQNMRRLQAFAKVGFDENSITDQMFSPQQLEDKAKIERAVASNMDEINDEEANQEFGEEYDFLVAEPKRKRDSSVIKSEINDTIKKMRSDLLRVAKGGNLNVTIPYADQIRVATPHIIKLSKLFAEDGVLKAKALVEAVYNEIKQVFPSLSKNDVAKIIKNENQPQTEKQKKNSKAAKVLKDLLIEAGYSRQATIKGEKRTLFDWKKLAGEEGSIENMRSKAEKVLKAKGYSESQIKEMQDALQEEYTNLRASIIEKSLKDLQSRNRIRPEVNIKSSAKRLAELYDRGLFEEDMSEYANLLNSALGFNEFDKATYKHLEDLAKALSVVYGYDSSVTGEKLTEQSVNTIKNKINNIVKQILVISALKQGNKKFKIASMFQEFIGLGMRSKLMSLSQMIQNPFSGFTERAFQRMGDFFDVKENGEIKANRKKLGKYIARDIRLKGGSFYGDVSMALVSTSKFETWLNSKSDNELYHLMLTSLTGRAYLEAADSANKAKLTEGLFVKNIISLLTSKSNPNGAMTKKEAMNFVAEQLGGQNLENARSEARKLIEKINKEVGREVIKPNTETIERMATDMVKEHLLTGQKISADMVEKSFRAAYKVAGYSIGHEANNVISKYVSIGNSMVEKELEKAVKDKKWDEATAMISLSILTKNILNPFLGGKTNWVVLQLQKTALDPFSMLYTWYKKKDNKLDLSTDEGIKNLEKALIYQQKLRTETVRYFVGASIALGMFLAAKATGADDDIDKWLKKNEWARKYFKLISPPALQLMISAKNKEMSKDISDMTGMSTDAFNDELKAIKSLDKEDDSTSGRIGKIIGAPADAPVPWRVVRDIDNVYRGIVGLPQVKSDYKVTGFWNGMMQGGLFDYMRLRPGINYDMQEEINKVKEETDRYNQKVDDLSKEINDDKLSEKQIQQRLIELFKDSPEKIKKTVDLLQDRKKEDLIREKVDSDFYIKLKREKNPSIKAVMIYYQFGDITKLSPEELSKIDKNMQMIGFEWNDEAVNKYGELINSKQKK